MFPDLIARVFATRNLAHLFHWNTHSYAMHKATGKLYADLPDLIDAVVEAYQGTNASLVGMVPLRDVRPPNLLAHLEEEAAWINANIDALSGNNCGVENHIQTLLGAYLSTIYKLRNLK